MIILDISHHHSAIDWDKAKKAGIDGAIIRAGRGSVGLDRMFHTHIKGAISAGVPVGVYYFSYAYTPKMAKREAAKCLEIIKPYKEKIKLPVFFDWEYDSMAFARKNGVRPGCDLITAMHKAFLEPIEQSGYRGGYYSNRDYIASGYIDRKALAGYVFWYARYTSTKQTDCDLWQYTETGKIRGIGGSFDLSRVINEKIMDAVPPSQAAPKEEKKTTARKSKVDILGGINMRTIKNGSTGKAVKIWQVIVGVPMDGIFGSQTEAATREFQKKKKLKETGIVEAETWKAGLQAVG